MERKIMTIAALKEILCILELKYSRDHQIWLSSDEEGNRILPMFTDPQLCVEGDNQQKRIIFYPTEQVP